MRLFIFGVLVGATVMAMPLFAEQIQLRGSSAFSEQIQREQERAEAQRERADQQLFREQQRQYSPSRSPC